MVPMPDAVRVTILVTQSATAENTQGDGPNANEYSSATVDSNNTTKNDVGNNKSAGNNRDNAGWAKAQDYGNAAANNGGSASAASRCFQHLEGNGDQQALRHRHRQPDPRHRQHGDQQR